MKNYRKTMKKSGTQAFEKHLGPTKKNLGPRRFRQVPRPRWEGPRIFFGWDLGFWTQFFFGWAWAHNPIRKPNIQKIAKYPRATSYWRIFRNSARASSCPRNTLCRSRVLSAPLPALRNATAVTMMFTIGPMSGPQSLASNGFCFTSDFSFLSF